ncbi:MAG: hypothetical protein KIC63_11740, partial [Clostridium sp.]|nr:hypothetical protein [Clostridium sp.]
GNITVNKRDIEDYFGYDTLKMIVRAPMVISPLPGSRRTRATDFLRLPVPRYWVTVAMFRFSFPLI